MPRGLRNGPNCDDAIRELYGAIKQQIIFFSAEVGVSAVWTATRLATLLSPERERVFDHLSELHREAPRLRGAVEPLALVGDARSSEASPAEIRRDSSKIRSYWDKMTQEERSAEMKRRMKKWSPNAKAKWSNGAAEPSVKKAKAKNGRFKLSKAERNAKQRIYVARSVARAKGLPLPPLPKELQQEAATV